jgi:HSP20 family protein
MTSIIRWDPFQELHAMNDRVSRLFGNESVRRQEREESLGSWIPPVDIVEAKDKIKLNVELPGFKESQVDLTVEDGMLTVRGERKFEKDTEDENYHRVERSYGSFLRSFTLPTSVDQTKIEAHFADGILSIEMPKREETRPKQIKITATSGNGKKDIDIKKSK